MWIFLPDAVLSIVRDSMRPQNLLVRARFDGDIQRYFPRAEVKEWPDRDYRFRASIPRADVGKVMARAIENITYGNFKEEAERRLPNDRPRLTALMEVWSVLRLEQERRTPTDLREPQAAFEEIKPLPKGTTRPKESV